MTMQADVAIVGGGLNGPVLALALAQAGLSVVLIDALPVARRADAGFDGRAYALALGSQRVLAALGVWGQAGAQAQPILGVHVADGLPGQPAQPWQLHFDAAEIEEPAMGYMVEDRHLRAALLAAIERSPAITQLAPARVARQATDGARARLETEDGQVVLARLIAGCDGRDSGTAARAGIARTGHDYGQTALVCALALGQPHGGVAHQLFLPGGPLAVLPLAGQRAAIVWSEATAAAAELAALSDDDFTAALALRLGGIFAPVALAGARFAYPLRLSLAESCAAPRLVLVGDAAHGVHPVAGQGLNLGLRDIAALADILAAARRRGEDIGAPAVLDRYVQARRFDTTTLALGTDALTWLFSNADPALRGLRGLGLGLAGAVPDLRRRMIREAAGLSGDLPRLMRGQPV